MLRSVVLNGCIVALGIVFSIYSLLISVIDKDGRRIHAWSARLWGRLVLLVCGIEVLVTGREGVDAGAPRIYMSSHQSIFDIFALLAYLPVDFKFLLKQELMWIPLLGPAMKKAGYIPVERDDPRKAILSIQTAAERIRSGASVLIFPEGTRSPDGVLQAFKRGGFNLALKAGCDIVPIGIAGSYRITPKGSRRINKGTFTLAIGRPIAVKGYGKRNLPRLMEEVRTAMAALMGQAADDRAPERPGA